MSKLIKIMGALMLFSLALAACSPAATETPTSTAEPTMAPTAMAENTATEAMPADTPTVEMATEAPTAEMPTEAPASTVDCMGSTGGQVSILGVWSGEEQTKFLDIFTPLTDACGITISYEGTRDLAALLTTRVQGGDPPDLTMMPNIGSLAQYKDQLIPMKDLGAHLENYSDEWLKRGSVDGVVVGLFVKTDVKSLAWYSPAEFAAAGYSVPTTWEDFVALVDQMKADGNMVPLSMGFESGAATGWTGTDFVQDIMLRTEGADFVGGIADGVTAWTDPGVKNAWEIYGNWAKDPSYALGGADGTVSTSFTDAIYAVFSDPPQAYMVKQSGFTGGTIAAQYPSLIFPDDYDFFVLPGMGGDPVPMQIGADAMAAFNNTPEVKAIVGYLTSAEGANAWAASGFDLSPNSKVDPASYTDPISAKKAQALLDAPGVSFDYGDLLPGGMGNDEFTAITNYINGGNLDTILGDMESEAQQLFNK